MTIDETDRKILATLDFGERQGFSQISKQLGLSRQLLDYRLKSLRRRGVLIGFRPIIDSYRLGFLYCRLFVRLSDLSPQRIARIAAFAAKTPQVLWCYQMRGHFNLVLSFWAKSVCEFEELSLRFLTQHGEALTQYNQNQIYRLRHYSIDRIVGSKKPRIVDIEESNDHFEIDALDKAMLRALSRDSRQPYNTLGAVCKTSDKVAAYRIERLEERGIIKGYRPIINWPLLGKFHWKIFMKLNLSARDVVRRVTAYISETPELFCILSGVGFPGEIDIEVVLDSYGGIFDYMERLQAKLPGCVWEYEQHEFTAVHKVDYLPL